MTHISDTKSYILSKYMFHHILATHGCEIHISIFQTPHNLNLHSTTLLFVANAHSDESQVSTLLLRTKVYPCFVWVMAPWYCLLLYYFFPKKTPFKSPQLNSNNKSHGPIKQSQDHRALKKYCDRLPQFNSKGIPPEPASMHYPPSMASQCTFPPQETHLLVPELGHISWRDGIGRGWAP